MILRLSNTTILTVTIIFFMSLLSCGKKSSPVPPIDVAPKPVSNFMIFPRSEAIILVWIPPRENTNDTPLTDLGGFKIFKAQESFEKFCSNCPRDFFQVFDYAYTGKRGLQPERSYLFYMDKDRTPKTVFSYKIQCYSERTVSGPPSPVIDIAWDTPLMEPSGLTEERRNRVIVLKWKNPELLEDGTVHYNEQIFYNVYRTETEGVYEEPPINKQLLSGLVYEDVPEKIDRTYFYTIRAVRKVMQTYIESRASTELAVDYFDITPPGKPHGLTAIPKPEGIFLKWIPKVERKIAGYNVYRRQAGEKGFSAINATLIKDRNSWLDTTAIKGRRYYYRITAVDSSAMANESGYSNEVEVDYIY